LAAYVFGHPAQELVSQQQTSAHPHSALTYTQYKHDTALNIA